VFAGLGSLYSCPRTRVKTSVSQHKASESPGSRWDPSFAEAKELVRRKRLEGATPVGVQDIQGLRRGRTETDHRC